MDLRDLLLPIQNSALDPIDQALMIESRLEELLERTPNLESVVEDLEMQVLGLESDIQEYVGKETEWEEFEGPLMQWYKDPNESNVLALRKVLKEWWYL